MLVTSASKSFVLLKLKFCEPVISVNPAYPLAVVNQLAPPSLEEPTQEPVEFEGKPPVLHFLDPE